MSVVYLLDGGTVAKVFRKGISLDTVSYEFAVALQAFRLGIPTPEPYEVVGIGEEQYAILYQYLTGDTLSAAITAHPEHLEEYAHQFAGLYKHLHDNIESTSSLTSNPSPLTSRPSPLTSNPSSLPSTPSSLTFPNAHVREAEAIRKIAPIFGEDGANRLLEILESVPQGHSLLHCDLHPRNVMLHEGRLMLIDVGEMGYGSPLLDLSHTHALMSSGLLDFERFVGFPAQYAKPFWDIVLRDYFGTALDADIIMRLDKVSLIRCFTWLSVPEGLPQEVLDRFKGHFKRLLSVP